MIKPLYDNVVLEKEKITRETSSGIVLSTKQEEATYGVVVAVGEGIMADGKKINMPFSVGDKVLYKTYGGQSVKDEGKDYLIIQAESIIAIIK